MGKLSQIEKVLASLKADRAVIDMAILKIEMQMKYPSVNRIPEKRKNEKAATTPTA